MLKTTLIISNKKIKTIKILIKIFLKVFYLRTTLINKITKLRNIVT